MLLKHYLTQSQMYIKIRACKQVAILENIYFLLIIAVIKNLHYKFGAEPLWIRHDQCVLPIITSIYETEYFLHFMTTVKASFYRLLSKHPIN